jgi:hypothetical protein
VAAKRKSKAAPRKRKVKRRKSNPHITIKQIRELLLPGFLLISKSIDDKLYAAAKRHKAKRRKRA